MPKSTRHYNGEQLRVLQVAEIRFALLRDARYSAVICNNYRLHDSGGHEYTGIHLASHLFAHRPSRTRHTYIAFLCIAQRLFLLPSLHPAISCDIPHAFLDTGRLDRLGSLRGPDS